MDGPQGLFSAILERASSLAGLRPPDDFDQADDFEDYDPDQLEDVARPASAKAVESLPTIAGAAAVGDSCSVCREKFSASDLLKKLPCDHVFHEGCVLRWLRDKNTCPLCRFEFEAEPLPESTCPLEADHRRMDALREVLAAMNVEPECPCEDCLRNTVCDLLSPAIMGLIPGVDLSGEGLASYASEVAEQRSREEAEFACCRCACTFASEAARNIHHTSAHYFCLECDSQFDSLHGAQLHHLSSRKHWDPKVHVCDTCKAAFKSSHAASLHSGLAHIEPNVGTCECNPFNFPLETAEEVYDDLCDSLECSMPICSHCCRIFPDEAAYRRHIALLTPLAS